MLRVAIVGCGKIADQHVHAIRRIADCEIVSLCDRELLMAQQLGERFGISSCFSDLAALLESTSPEIVHITTPPGSHFPLASQCLNAGSHVFVEKPFTVNATEAEGLIALAEERGLNITAGHNYQFTAEMIRARSLVKQGFLGGKPAHLESHWSYDLEDLSYVAPVVSNRDHWVRRLPGQLLHNIISHGIARLTEYLNDDLAEITASGQQSARLRNLGGEEVLDELRVLIRDGGGSTAFFCFSTQLRPGLNQLRICGPVNSLLVDLASGSLIRSKTRSFKSYLSYFIPPLLSAKEHLRNAGLNFTNFFRGRLHQDFGMKSLIEKFYECIRNGEEPPIPYREIILTAKIMDEIFTQIYPEKAASPLQVVGESGR